MQSKQISSFRVSLLFWFTSSFELRFRTCKLYLNSLSKPACCLEEKCGAANILSLSSVPPRLPCFVSILYHKWNILSRGNLFFFIDYKDRAMCFPRIDFSVRDRFCSRYLSNRLSFYVVLPVSSTVAFFQIDCFLAIS